MRAIVQRVARASVTVDGVITGRINRGFLVLLGCGHGDTESDVDYMVNKISGLRVFPDDDGLMNLSVQDIGGAILAVSQFTLFGDCRKGRRPSFAAAMAPEAANLLYESYVTKTRALGIEIGTGIFRAHMDVELLNDGPVTLMIDSRKTF
ncbi:MAG: D-tyrosyl-tRNA(Tyr) deacylase [Myxococcota bacterium]|jgi:D-tyrosyl-tRNA(Tyr) deacylase